MFEDFFENNAPADEEQPGRERTEQIKAAVLQRITRVNAESEEKKMKRIHLRPFVIAAAAAAVGAGSLVTANAATNGAVADSMTRALTVFSGDSAEQSGEWTEVSEGDDGSVVYYTAPDDEAGGADNSADTASAGDWSVYYYTIPDDAADGSDLEIRAIVADEWIEAQDTLPDDKADSSDHEAYTTVSDGDAVYYYLPDDAEDKSYYSAATIVKREGDVVYYTFPDGVQDGEDILYDFIFSLENDDAAK